MHYYERWDAHNRARQLVRPAYCCSPGVRGGSLVHGPAVVLLLQCRGQH
jgi:hypothetical protein